MNQSQGLIHRILLIPFITADSSTSLYLLFVHEDFK
jgi:hypothetical protein